MIISLDITQLVYSDVYSYIQRIPELTESISKCGAVVLGWYFVEGGGHGEVVCITKWEGIQERSAGFEKVMREMGYTKLQQDVMKCVAHIHNFLCIPNPTVSIENWAPNNRRLMLRMYKTVGTQADVAKKYVDMAHYFKDKIGVSSSLIAILHPVAFQGPIGLITITEEGPNGIDSGLQKILNAAADPDHAQALREMNKQFEVVSSRLISPYNAKLINEFLAKKE